MSVAAILAPLFVLVALTFLLMFWTGGVRTASIKSGETRARDIVLGQDNWPPRVLQIGNAYNNQFQLPVLFYVASLVALWLGPTLLELVLAYAFVATRYVHAAIHITTNNVVRRFAAYTAGLVVLCVFWADLLVRTLLIAFGAN